MLIIHRVHQYASMLARGNELALVGNVHFRAKARIIRKWSEGAGDLLSWAAMITSVFTAAYPTEIEFLHRLRSRQL